MSEMKTYPVNFIETNKLIITGNANSSLWDKAYVLKDFISPWAEEHPKKMEFKALWDSEKLFFCFKVYEKMIYIDKKNDSKESIGNSDRVELFFRTNESLNPYYCLEIDPTPRVMDFKAYPNKKFNFQWDWPKNSIEVKSNITEFGYTVEGAISIVSLKKLNLVKNNIVETGIFRAKYTQNKNQDFEPSWLTWVNPKTKTPNFHIASSFGALHFVQNKTI